MEKVQTLVRGIPGIKWIPSFSKIYKDTSYSKTQKKVRFNFDKFYYDGDLTSAELEAKIVGVLNSAGHSISYIQTGMSKVMTDDLLCIRNEGIDASDDLRSLWLLIYQEFPIKVVEL